MNKILEINGWLLPEYLATPRTTALVIFYETDGWRKDTAALAFRTVSAQHEGSVRFLKINTDENPSVLQAYGVQTLPTLVLFVEGKEVVRRTGSVDDRAVTEMIARKETST